MNFQTISYKVTTHHRNDGTAVSKTHPFLSMHGNLLVGGGGVMGCSDFSPFHGHGSKIPRREQIEGSNISIPNVHRKKVIEKCNFSSATNLGNERSFINCEGFYDNDWKSGGIFYSMSST